MIKTMEDLKNATDEELIKMYNDAQGDTANFKSIFETDFSYNTLVNAIKDRGYTMEWVKSTKDTVDVRMSKDNSRMNLNMTKECKEKYEKFLADKGYAFVHTTAALMTYMDAYKKRKIDVKVVL